MKMTGNTILITGGGSGIGRALAEAFQKLGNQVIITGRRQNLLDSVTAANPGMQSMALDMQDPAALAAFGAEAARRFPALNVAIFNAGVMMPEKVEAGGVSDAEAMVVTNLLGPIRLIASLLPLLSKQKDAALMTVSSGLAFVPLAMTPTYCATKAAIHSYTESLRHQLKGSSVSVLELVPPYVATELIGSHQANDPRAMPLGEFVSEVMEILKTQPDATEICVKRVLPLRHLSENGPAKYQEFFETLNSAAF